MFNEKRSAVITYSLVLLFNVLVAFVFFPKEVKYLANNTVFLIGLIVLGCLFLYLSLTSIGNIENPSTPNAFHWIAFFSGIALAAWMLFWSSDMRSRKGENIKGEFGYFKIGDQMPGVSLYNPWLQHKHTPKDKGNPVGRVYVKRIDSARFGHVQIVERTCKKCNKVYPSERILDTVKLQNGRVPA